MSRLSRPTRKQIVQRIKTDLGALHPCFLSKKGEKFLEAVENLFFNTLSDELGTDEYQQALSHAHLLCEMKGEAVLSMSPADLLPQHYLASARYAPKQKHHKNIPPRRERKEQKEGGNRKETGKEIRREKKETEQEIRREKKETEQENRREKKEEKEQHKEKGKGKEHSEEMEKNKEKGKDKEEQGREKREDTKQRQVKQGNEVKLPAKQEEGKKDKSEQKAKNDTEPVLPSIEDILQVKKLRFLLKCGICPGDTQVEWISIQLRGADENETHFAHCCNCGSRWTV